MKVQSKNTCWFKPQKIPVLTWVQTWVLHDFMWFHGQILFKDSKEKSQDRNKISGFMDVWKGPFSVDPWGPPTFGESQVSTAPAETAGANGSRNRQLRCLPSTLLLGVAGNGDMTWVFMYDMIQQTDTNYSQKNMLIEGMPKIDEYWAILSMSIGIDRNV